MKLCLVLSFLIHLVNNFTYSFYFCKYSFACISNQIAKKRLCMPVMMNNATNTAFVPEISIGK